MPGGRNPTADVRSDRDRISACIVRSIDTTRRVDDRVGAPSAVPPSYFGVIREP